MAVCEFSIDCNRYRGSEVQRFRVHRFKVLGSGFRVQKTDDRAQTTDDRTQIEKVYGVRYKVYG